MLQFMIRLIPISLLLLPNSLLNVIGINYMGTGGSALGKLHPSFYISLVALALTFLVAKSWSVQVPEWIRGVYRLPLAIGLLAAFVTLLLARSGTGDISAAIVTFVTPAIIAYVLQFASDKTKAFFHQFIVLFFIVNSLIGIVELVTEWRLLPYYVAGEVVTFDRRPTALLGHPLLNALLTGMVLLSMITRHLTLGQRLPQMAQMTLHATAILAFGGRASLALMVILTAIYLLRHTGLVVRVTARQSLRSLTLVFFGAAFIVILTALGVTDALLDRFVNAAESTNTRFAAVRLLEMISMKEWLIGVEGGVRAYYLTILETPYGIEISPIAMIYVYGLPLTILLIFSTYRLLFQWAGQGYPGARYTVSFIILSSITSLSIGSKTLLISQAMVIIFALREQHKAVAVHSGHQHASVERRVISPLAMDRN